MDPDQIRTWWKRWPTANIGIATGNRSFDVLDVDLKGDGPDTLRELELLHGELPDTIEQITGSGGRQIMFKPTGGKLTNAVKFASGLDIRTNGGLVVVPPSRHVSGGTYEWEASSLPNEKALADCPAWLISMVRKASEKPSSGTGTRGKVDVESLWEGIPEGARDRELYRYACRLRSQNMSRDEAETLVLAAAGKCKPPFPPADALLKVGAAWKYPAGGRGVFPCTDLGNGERFAAQHAGVVKYCHSWAKWFLWDGRRWKPDGTSEVMALAKQVVRSILGEASQCDDKDIRKAVAGWAFKSERRSAIEAMLALARSEPGIPIEPNRLDQDRWLLNTLSGTIDLKSGTHRKNDPADLITKVVPVTCDHNATCPTWESFLDRIMGGNDALISFLRRAVGYSLTGDDSEQCIFLCHGSGANGKSTFLDTIKCLLGDYSRQAEFSTFLIKKSESVRNDIADLRGARFVSAIEAESEQRLAESIVKQMTGGDTVKARFLFQEYFEFQPEFKIWLAANHKPIIRGNDHAIWRRIRLIPFTVTIPEGERDPRLKDKLKAELPGILNWALMGCAEWQEHGLGMPDEVLAATSDYRAEMDVLAEFISDCCLVDTRCSVSKAELFESYERWARDNGEEPLKKRTFGQRLSERGLTEERASGGHRRWRGIGLLARTVTATSDTTDKDHFCREPLHRAS